MSIATIVIVLAVVFQFKHFVADYLLQGKYMLGKFKPNGWELPLAAHCGVHFVFTFLIVLCIASLPVALGLATLDFMIHFTMDRVKASPELLGRYKALSASEYPTATPDRIKANTYFWWSLGFDQLVHHLTDLLVIYLMVTI